MGPTCSHNSCFPPLFRRPSKSAVSYNDRQASEVADTDSQLVNSAHATLNDLHLLTELVPERYLVVLTEQMTEMVFRLMTYNESSVGPSDGGVDHRPPLEAPVDSSKVSTPSSNSTAGQSTSSPGSSQQPCLKCHARMLTMEEFRELHAAFRRFDNDRNNYLSRDEIRTALSYLFELTEFDIKEIISVFDVNQDDQISLEEYIEVMKHRLLHEFTRDEIKLAFDQADVHRNGHLRMDELKNAIAHLNLHLPNRRILEIVHSCMTDGSVESIDFLHFTHIIESLHRREPITLQKFKPIHHHTYSPVAF